MSSEAEHGEDPEDPEAVGLRFLKGIAAIHVDLRTPPADGEEAGTRAAFAREQALVAIYERIGRICRSDLAAAGDC